MGIASFHDGVARTALRNGDSSAMFRAAAQSWANWTWIWLIVAAVVWYFANVWWAIIPLVLLIVTAAQSVSSTMVAVRLEKIEAVGAAAGIPEYEAIVTKADVDRIYGLDRVGWEAYAKSVTRSGSWKILLQPHDSGTAVSAFYAPAGIGYSIQPIYIESEKTMPVSLVVTRLFPIEASSQHDDVYRANLESALQKDLGATYSVRSNAFKRGNFLGFELNIYRTEANTRRIRSP